MATRTHTTPTTQPEGAPRAGGRRSLLGAVTALACTPVLGALARSSPDAGLFRLCNAFHEAHAATLGADDASWEAHLGRRWEISDAIEEITPTTDAGRLAKARVALVLMEENASAGNSHEAFAIAALRDLIGAAA